MYTYGEFIYLPFKSFSLNEFESLGLLSVSCLFSLLDPHVGCPATNGAFSFTKAWCQRSGFTLCG